MNVDDLVEEVNTGKKTVKNAVCEYLENIKQDSDDVKENRIANFINRLHDIDAYNKGKHTTMRQYVMSNWPNWDEEICK